MGPVDTEDELKAQWTRVGDAVKDRRLALGWTQQEAADRAGVSLATWRLIELAGRGARSRSSPSAGWSGDSAGRSARSSGCGPVGPRRDPTRPPTRHPTPTTSTRPPPPGGGPSTTCNPSRACRPASPGNTSTSPPRSRGWSRASWRASSPAAATDPLPGKLGARTRRGTGTDARFRSWRGSGGLSHRVARLATVVDGPSIRGRRSTSIADLQVVFDPVAGSMGGGFHVRADERAVIVLDPELDAHMRRAVLTHELVHHERGGGPGDRGARDARPARRARRARRRRRGRPPPGPGRRARPCWWPS